MEQAAEGTRNLYRKIGRRTTGEVGAA
jgi:hypothetical protein